MAVFPMIFQNWKTKTKTKTASRVAFHKVSGKDSWLQGKAPGRASGKGPWRSGKVPGKEPRVLGKEPWELKL